MTVRSIAPHDASDEEIRDIFALASITTRCSSMVHAQQYPMDYFEDGFTQIADHLQEQMDA